MHVKLPITASVDEKEDWKLILVSQLYSLLPCLQIKRVNNSRNWETGVSTGVVTCTSEVRAELLGVWNVVALSRMLNSNSNILRSVCALVLYCNFSFKFYVLFDANC